MTDGPITPNQALKREGLLDTIDIVFDGPPGPDGPRFVEVETIGGISFSLGKWIQREDGYWVIRFRPADLI